MKKLLDFAKRHWKPLATVAGILGLAAAGAFTWAEAIQKAMIALGLGSF